MKMSHSDLNPAVTGTGLPHLDAAAIARLTQVKAVVPKYPPLDLELLGPWMLVEIEEDEMPAIETGGIYAGRQQPPKPKMVCIAKIVVVGPQVQTLKVGDRVLLHKSNLEEISFDERFYSKIHEQSIFAKVQ
jgi:co-chaperonin GroES (HSP10)